MHLIFVAPVQIKRRKGNSSIKSAPRCIDYNNHATPRTYSVNHDEWPVCHDLHTRYKICCWGLLVCCKHISLDTYRFLTTGILLNCESRPWYLQVESNWTNELRSLIPMDSNRVIHTCIHHSDQSIQNSFTGLDKQKTISA